MWEMKKLTNNYNANIKLKKVICSHNSIEIGKTIAIERRELTENIIIWLR
jgi:hypothetical protein